MRLARFPLKRVSRAALAGAALAGLAGCAAEDPLGGAPSPPPSAAGTGTPTPAAAADAFPRLREAAGVAGDTAGLLAGGIAGAAELAGDAGSASADLRAGLTSLLVEHAYLVLAGEPAEQALAANTAALAEGLGPAVSDAGREEFADAWTEHIEDLRAFAAEDDADERAATASLVDFAREQGESFAALTDGALDASAVQQSLGVHITALAAAIEAAAAGSDDAVALAGEAAEDVAGTAATLAAGLADAADLDGSSSADGVVDEAAALRADLAGVLVGHVYGLGVAVLAGESADGSPARAGVDADARELAELIGAVAPVGRQATFLRAWRGHVDDLVSYAEGAAAADPARVQAALASLEAYGGSAADFFADVTDDELAAEDVAAELEAYVAALARALDALVAAAAQG